MTGVSEVTAQTALASALREVVGPAARANGYKGSAPNWRRSNASGDLAVVNVQSSSYSTAGHLRCVINLAVAPEPWLRWEREKLGARMPKQVVESLGLFRQRLHPTGTPEGADGWWDVEDSDSARAAAVDMVSQLERDGWPVLDRMLDPEGMLERIRSGDLGLMKRENFGGIIFDRAEALLLMGEGPSDALNSLLTRALDGVRPEQREHAERFNAWVLEQAQIAG
jgi:hypothetical protein